MSTSRPATLSGHPSNRPAATATVREQPRRYTQLPRFFRWFSGQCVLRQIDDSDVARIWRAVLHPSFEHCWSGRVPRSEAEVADMVRQAQLDWQRGTRYTMAVLRKQTHEFVGWVEVRASSIRAAWVLDWFFHPSFVADPITREAIGAAAELMFGALDAHTLYANCPRQHWLFEQVLNDSGFIALVPAGSIDPATGRPRAHTLFELGRQAWQLIRGERDDGAAGTASAFASSVQKLELSLL